jgi:hypothetical protein
MIVRSASVREQRFALGSTRCENRSPDEFPPAITCVAAVRAMPRTAIALERSNSSATARAGSGSYAPYDAVLAQDPVRVFPVQVLEQTTLLPDTRAAWAQPDTRIVLTPQHPVAHLRRDVVFRGVRLSGYTLTPTPSVPRSDSSAPREDVP